MMLVHIYESRLMHGKFFFKFIVRVVWCRLIGTGCYRLSVQIDSERLTLAVVDSVTVIGFLHLAFIFQGGCMGQRQVVVATFRLYPKNLRGCSLLLVVAIELAIWRFPQVVA
jgi:hypothetical protein